jgi:hypothetical protein
LWTGILVKIPQHILAYEKKCFTERRPPVLSALGGIEQIVVIPALAEKRSLPATLAGLAGNPHNELRRTLILCVINNRGSHLASPREIDNNQDTINYLQALINGLPGDSCDGDKDLAEVWPKLRQSPLRLAYIDASSPGREMPDKSGGVGAARKTGMDAALRLFDYTISGEKLLISLDADTLVEDNYLEAIRNYFLQNKAAAAVVNFVHQRPVMTRRRIAICAYEIFLRYYVLGLRYAGSPYSFHTVGSAMACTADAYVAVGGMNMRDAAEDFYFLNKLAKYRAVGQITATTVHPSARPSWRVPFGTGRRIIRFLERREDEFLLYDPRVFLVLKKWLDNIKASPDREAEAIISLSKGIDPLLAVFLEINRFPEIWQSIRANVKKREGLLRHFHFWFDGFKTMKLIHFLTEHGYAQIDMFQAIAGLLSIREAGPSQPD